MKLTDIASELSADVLCGSESLLGAEAVTVTSSDLMSDVLAGKGLPDILLTGLTTVQAVRTCAVAGIKAVVIVRGKPVDDRVIELARQEDIILMLTPLSLFEASGRLYERGLRSAFNGP